MTTTTKQEVSSRRPLVMGGRACVVGAWNVKSKRTRKTHRRLRCQRVQTNEMGDLNHNAIQGDEFWIDLNEECCGWVRWIEEEGIRRSEVHFFDAPRSFSIDGFVNLD